jgi:subfamily B ATP-binding cassette protein HlyB/CyaB
LDARDLDGLPFEFFELLQGGIVLSDMDRLVRVTDAGGVVIEADVAPRGKIDEVTIFRVRAGRSLGRKLAGEVADLLTAGVFLQPREIIGIVGPSGSGKSTLTKLVQRFYIPNSGQVFIDGQDIAEADPSWLRSNIGVVLQENLLFNRTIHDNIALANPSMSREAVIRMARLSGADEFIAKLPRGYETVIEERGANLSGGQRQRLAIARALATNPPILILDEATSALDYESERIMLANMREIVRGRTVIIIAHRLATVRHCDRIIGMKDGRLIEEGTHDTLLSSENGLYAHLWRLQSGSSHG